MEPSRRAYPVAPANSAHHARRGSRPRILYVFFRGLIHYLKICTVHSRGIIHRDIKPANVVYTEDRLTVKLIDFGIAHYTPPASEGVDPSSPFSEKDLTRRLGTPSFLSPEVAWWPAQDSDLSSLPLYANHLPDSATNPKALQVPSTQPPVTTAVDIWALGVTLYCFLFGVLPFKVTPTENDNAYRTEYALYLIIMALEWYPGQYIASDQIPTAGRYPPKSHNTFPVIRLLDRMLQKDPAHRMSLQEVKVCTTASYIASVGSWTIVISLDSRRSR